MALRTAAVVNVTLEMNLWNIAQEGINIKMDYMSDQEKIQGFLKPNCVENAVNLNLPLNINSSSSSF